MVQMKQISLIVAAMASALMSIAEAGPDKRSINLINQSGSKVEVHWIHPDTGERVLQSNPFIYDGATFTLNSFVTHEFEVRELPAKDGKCKSGEDQQTCGLGYFVVKDSDEQNFFIGKNIKVEYEDTRTIAQAQAKGLLSECQKMALDAVAAEPDKAADIIEKMSSCVESSVAKEMEAAKEEITFQATVRKNMAELLENYTCADYDLPSTEPLRTEYWKWKGVRRKVNIMHDRPASKVHVIQNFISKDECKAMEDAAAKKLHRATVADGKGGSELSPNRKAMQAGIRIPWEKEKEGNLLADLSRRVYDYTDHVLKMGIDEHGQEDLMSIQYEGRGEDDKEPDRYMPHCDGDCTGLDHKDGQRMATVVIYCDVPEKGGATNFRNAGLHVVPEAGSATFFSYIDPETMRMDTGFTEHSGCPVIEGEKKIVTQWVRYGVDNENPWDSFNTLGIKYSEANKQ